MSERLAPTNSSPSTVSTGTSSPPLPSLSRDVGNHDYSSSGAQTQLQQISGDAKALDVPLSQKLAEANSDYAQVLKETWFRDLGAEVDATNRVHKLASSPGTELDTESNSAMRITKHVGDPPMRLRSLSTSSLSASQMVADPQPLKLSDGFKDEAALANNEILLVQEVKFDVRSTDELGKVHTKTHWLQLSPNEIKKVRCVLAGNGDLLQVDGEGTSAPLRGTQIVPAPGIDILRPSFAALFDFTHNLSQEHRSSCALLRAMRTEIEEHIKPGPRTPPSMLDAPTPGQFGLEVELTKCRIESERLRSDLDDFKSENELLRIAARALKNDHGSRETAFRAAELRQEIEHMLHLLQQMGKPDAIQKMQNDVSKYERRLEDADQRCKSLAEEVKRTRDQQHETEVDLHDALSFNAALTEEKIELEKRLTMTVSQLNKDLVQNYDRLKAEYDLAKWQRSQLERMVTASLVTFQRAANWHGQEQIEIQRRAEIECHKISVDEPQRDAPAPEATPTSSSYDKMQQSKHDRVAESNEFPGTVLISGIPRNRSEDARLAEQENSDSRTGFGPAQALHTAMKRKELTKSIDMLQTALSTLRGDQPYACVYRTASGTEPQAPQIHEPYENFVEIVGDGDDDSQTQVMVRPSMVREWSTEAHEYQQTYYTSPLSLEWGIPRLRVAKIKNDSTSSVHQRAGQETESLQILFQHSENGRVWHCYDDGEIVHRYADQLSLLGEEFWPHFTPELRYDIETALIKFDQTWRSEIERQPHLDVRQWDMFYQLRHTTELVADEPVAVGRQKYVTPDPNTLTADQRVLCTVYETHERGYLPLAMLINDDPHVVMVNPHIKLVDQHSPWVLLLKELPSSPRELPRKPTRYYCALPDNTKRWFWDDELELNESTMRLQSVKELQSFGALDTSTLESTSQISHEPETTGCHNSEEDTEQDIRAIASNSNTSPIRDCSFNSSSSTEHRAIQQNATTLQDLADIQSHPSRVEECHSPIQESRPAQMQPTMEKEDRPSVVSDKSASSRPSEDLSDTKDEEGKERPNAATTPTSAKKQIVEAEELRKKDEEISELQQTLFRHEQDTKNATKVSRSTKSLQRSSSHSQRAFISSDRTFCSENPFLPLRSDSAESSTMNEISAQNFVGSDLDCGYGEDRTDTIAVNTQPRTAPLLGIFRHGAEYISTQGGYATYRVLQVPLQMPKGSDRVFVNIEIPSEAYDLALALYEGGQYNTAQLVAMKDYEVKKYEAIQTRRQELYPDAILHGSTKVPQAWLEQFEQIVAAGDFPLAPEFRELLGMDEHGKDDRLSIDILTLIHTPDPNVPGLETHFKQPKPNIVSPDASRFTEWYNKTQLCSEPQRLNFSEVLPSSRGPEIKVLSALHDNIVVLEDCTSKKPNLLNRRGVELDDVKVLSLSEHARLTREQGRLRTAYNIELSARQALTARSILTTQGSKHFKTPYTACSCGSKFLCVGQHNKSVTSTPAHRNRGVPKTAKTGLYKSSKPPPNLFLSRAKTAPWPLLDGRRRTSPRIRWAKLERTSHSKVLAVTDSSTSNRSASWPIIDLVKSGRFVPLRRNQAAQPADDLTGVTKLKADMSTQTEFKAGVHPTVEPVVFDSKPLSNWQGSKDGTCAVLVILCLGVLLYFMVISFASRQQWLLSNGLCAFNGADFTRRVQQAQIGGWEWRYWETPFLGLFFKIML